MFPSFLSIFLSISPLLLTTYATPFPQCRPIPGDHTWPLNSEWAELNQTVSNRLVRPTPPGAVCHEDQSFVPYNAGKCQEVRAEWTTNWTFQTNDLVSMSINNWANDTCLPFKGFDCSAAGYPSYVINATTTADVQAGVLFAGKHNLRLIIHSTGHDLLGRSNAPNSLSINTHHLKTLTMHQSFAPQSCDHSQKYAAVTLGPGSQWGDVYTTLAKHNLTVVGGGCSTVSVGGYMTGGGYGTLTASRGLAVDNLLEVELLLANGSVVVANACQNSDLFWATRGGGGSTFGVLISATFKTYQTPRIASVHLIAAGSKPYATGTASMVAYILSQFPYFMSHNMSGALFGGPNQTVLTTKPSALYTLGINLVDSVDEDRARQVMEPVAAHLRKSFPDYNISVSTTSSATWLDYYTDFHDPNSPGSNELVTSRLICEEGLTGGIGSLMDAAESITSNADLIIGELVGGPGMSNADREATSVQPGWKTAIIHLIAVKVWEPTAQMVPAYVRTALAEMTDPLRKLAPDSGAYINESDALDPDWKTLYWGKNYERLLSIKRSVDPTDVFWCPLCVGNERWKEEGGRVCQVEC